MSDEMTTEQAEPAAVEVPADLMGRIKTARRGVADALGGVEIAKAELKEAKEQLAGEQLRLAELVDELIGAAPGPLFDDDHGDDEDDEAGDGGGDDWRGELLEELAEPAIAARALKALREAGIETAGQLADAQRKHGELWPDTICGLGQAGRQSVDDAIDGLFQRRRDAGADGHTETQRRREE